MARVRLWLGSGLGIGCHPAEATVASREVQRGA